MLVFHVLCAAQGQNRVVMIAPKEDHIISQIGKAELNCAMGKRCRTHLVQISLAPIHFEKFIKRMKRNHYFYTYTLIIILPECVELTCQPITWFSFSFCLVSSFYTDAFLFSLYFAPFLTLTLSLSLCFILSHFSAVMYCECARICAWVWVLCVVQYTKKRCSFFAEVVATMVSSVQWWAN